MGSKNESAIEFAMSLPDTHTHTLFSGAFALAFREKDMKYWKSIYNL